MEDSALARVEAQRVELELNIAKLKKSLRHWQALEIDYQGLSEEFIGRSEGLSKEESLKIAQEYGTDVVDEKELRELLNYDKGNPRKPEQVIELLSKRIDYVNRNVKTVKKQLNDAQKKRNILLLAEEPEFRDDAGLPLTEITEELDEDGRVLSSKVQRSDEAAPQLAAVLKKAGVKDIEEVAGKIVSKELNKVENTNSDRPSPEYPIIQKQSRLSESLERSSIRQTQDARMVQDSPNDIDVVSEADVGVAKNKGKITESVEDAALRAEMLQYHDGLGEVGAIVAELDLEDDDITTGDDGEEDLLFDSDYDEDEDFEDESEDEKGMSRHSLYSDAYLRRMKQLETKHGITGMTNLCPRPDLPIEIQDQIDRPPAAEAARKAALARAEAAATSDKAISSNSEKDKKPRAKKKVAFAKDLDIAQEDDSRVAIPESKSKRPIVLTANPLKETIIERPVKDVVESEPTPAAKKVSRFKAARSEIPQTPMFAPGSSEMTETPKTEEAHQGPAGKVYEPTIIERPTPSETSAPRPGEDEFGVDNAMHQRQIATEYHQLRNRLIQRQGGFVNEGENENWGDATAALPEEDHAGKLRKVSRFKAARMK